MKRHPRFEMQPDLVVDLLRRPRSRGGIELFPSRRTQQRRDRLRIRQKLRAFTGQIRAAHRA